MRNSRQALDEADVMTPKRSTYKTVVAIPIDAILTSGWTRLLGETRDNFDFHRRVIDGKGPDETSRSEVWRECPILERKRLYGLIVDLEYDPAIGQEHGIGRPEVLCESLEVVVIDSETQSAKVNLRGSWLYLVHGVNFELPAVIVQPTLIELDHIAWLLSEPGSDFHVFRQSHNRTLCANSEEANSGLFRFVAREAWADEDLQLVLPYTTRVIRDPNCLLGEVEVEIDFQSRLSIPFRPLVNGVVYQLAYSSIQIVVGNNGVEDTLRRDGLDLSAWLLQFDDPKIRSPGPSPGPGG